MLISVVEFSRYMLCYCAKASELCDDILTHEVSIHFKPHSKLSIRHRILDDRSGEFINYIVISIFWYWINWQFEAKKGSKYHEISLVSTAILNNAIWKTCVALSLSTVLAGDLVLLGARASAGIVMTTFGVRPTPPQTDGTFFPIWYRNTSYLKRCHLNDIPITLQQTKFSS